jgi:hypothetical protein
VCMYEFVGMCVCVYIYIYIHTHIHTSIAGPIDVRSEASSLREYLPISKYTLGEWREFG